MVAPAALTHNPHSGEQCLPAHQLLAPRRLEVLTCCFLDQSPLNSFNILALPGNGRSNSRHPMIAFVILSEFLIEGSTDKPPGEKYRGLLAVAHIFYHHGTICTLKKIPEVDLHFLMAIGAHMGVSINWPSGRCHAVGIVSTNHFSSVVPY